MSKQLDQMNIALVHADGIEERYVVGREAAIKASYINHNGKLFHYKRFQVEPGHTRLDFEEVSINKGLYNLKIHTGEEGDFPVLEKAAQ